MSLINKELINQVLENLPKEVHSLYLKQVDKMEELIQNDKELYKTNTGFRVAFDKVLKEVIIGSFLNLNEELN